MKRLAVFLEQIRDISEALAASGGVLAGAAAAHAHLAAATAWVPGAEPRYLALTPRNIRVLGAHPPAGAVADTSEIGAVVTARLDLFTVRLVVGGRSIPALAREAVLAELLAQGGLSLGLAGLVLRLAQGSSVAPIDVDEVRELLKAARLPERFQPMLELIHVCS